MVLNDRVDIFDSWKHRIVQRWEQRWGWDKSASERWTTARPSEFISDRLLNVSHDLRPQARAVSFEVGYAPTETLRCMKENNFCAALASTMKDIQSFMMDTNACTERRKNEEMRAKTREYLVLTVEIHSTKAHGLTLINTFSSTHKRGTSRTKSGSDDFYVWMFKSSIIQNIECLDFSTLEYLNVWIFIFECFNFWTFENSNIEYLYDSMFTMFNRFNVCMFQISNIQILIICMFQCLNILTFEHLNVWIFECLNLWCYNVRMFEYLNVYILKFLNSWMVKWLTFKIMSIRMFDCLFEYLNV